jgi:hypothetical protein
MSVPTPTRVAPSYFARICRLRVKSWDLRALRLIISAPGAGARWNFPELSLVLRAAAFRGHTSAKGAFSPAQKTISSLLMMNQQTRSEASFYTPELCVSCLGGERRLSFFGTCWRRQIQNRSRLVPIIEKSFDHLGSQEWN